jgi:Exonuclease
MIPAYFRSWVNIKKVFGRVLGVEARGMAEMLHLLDMPLIGRHHSGLDDCRNIAVIALRLIDGPFPALSGVREDRRHDGATDTGRGSRGRGRGRGRGEGVNDRKTMVMVEVGV